MELDRAREIVRALADGLDPLSGQRLPANSPCRQSDVVSAFRVALEAMDRKGSPPRPIERNLQNVGAGWTTEEEQRLRSAFQAGKTIAEIARSHGRGEGGITARLVRLGLLQQDRAQPARMGTAATPQRPNPRPPPLPTREDDDLPS
jgi:hypothetical protein